MIPVGDHDPAESQRGRDHLMEELPSSGHEEVHLRFPIELHAAGQEQLAHPFAELGTSWFPHDDGLAVRELLAQQLDLGGLA